MLPLDAANFRAEAARYKIKRDEISELINMNRSEVSRYMNESIDPVYAWALHNIGYALNTLIGRKVFRVNMKKGIIVPRPGPKSKALSRQRFPLLAFGDLDRMEDGRLL